MKFRELQADEIDCRVSTINAKGASLLLYKDARADMNILDECVGAENWQRTHEVINGNLFCNVGIYIPERNEWIWKQDVGTESYTEKEKGQASDSFKRACFNFGIGRSLYTAPFIWVNAKDINMNDKGDKKTTYDHFSVKEIDYDNGKIVHLAIYNDDKKKVVFTWSLNAGGFKEDKPITEAKLKAKVLSHINRHYPKKEQQDAILKNYGVKSLSDLTIDQLNDYKACVESKGGNLDE